MKLAITGKGGVGKTTFTALAACALVQRGFQVFAIDADPNTTLLGCMGHPDPDSVEPLVNLTDLIEERTGARPGHSGGMFRLNPFVEDIPAEYAQDMQGVKVLVAGAVKRGGAGCYCPENAMVRALISHLLYEPDVALVVDLEAGIEHLGRGTVSNVDQLVIITEPSRSSIQTTRRIQELAGDLKLDRIAAVGSKIRNDADKIFLETSLPDVAFVGFIPYDENLRDAERAGRSVAGASPAIDTEVDRIVSVFQSELNNVPSAEEQS